MKKMTDSVAQIIDNTKKVFEAIERAQRASLEAIGSTAERYAKEGCPVKTNRLRSSISHAVVDNDYAVIGTNVEYAPYVEFDDSKNHTVGGAHFLRNAATLHNEEYESIARNIMKNA